MSSLLAELLSEHLTNHPSALQPCNNLNHRVQASAGGTHNPNTDNRLQLICESVNLEQPEEKKSHVTFEEYDQQIQEKSDENIPDELAELYCIEWNEFIHYNCGNVVDFTNPNTPDEVPEQTPLQFAAQPQQPIQQCLPTVESNIELDPDSEKSFIVLGVQNHPADKQGVTNSKSDMILHPNPAPDSYSEQLSQQCTALENNMELTAHSGKSFTIPGVQNLPANNQSVISSKSDTIPHSSPSPLCCLEQTSQQFTMELDYDLQQTFVDNDYQNTADNQSLSVSKYQPIRPMSCNINETAYTGDAMQMLHNSITTSVHYPTTTNCQPQQKQHSTTAASMKLQTDVQKEHPYLVRSGLSCGPADKKSLLNPLNQEHLASDSVNEFNGHPSTSSHDNNSSCETPQNEKSNGKTSSNRFPRKGQREYTKEELEKMRRNNEASKKSREKRRMEEKNREREKEYLERKNQVLKAKLNTMKLEYNKGSAQLCRMFTLISYRTRELSNLDTKWTADNFNRQ